MRADWASLDPSTSAADLGPVAVVDDDPTTRHILRHWLEDMGYRIIEHASGREVLSSTAEVAAVCLDLNLDDIPGLELLRHLQAKDANLPVVVVTVQGDVDTAVEAMRRGAYDFLVNSLDRERLLHAVRRAVERRELAVSVERLKS